MLSLNPRARIYVASGAVDLRKSFDGLTALAEGTLGLSTRSGDLFVFLNRRGTQMRVLYWDGEGYCLWMKRLELGTFRRVTGPEGAMHVEVDAASWSLLLMGVDAVVTGRRRRLRAA